MVRVSRRQVAVGQSQRCLRFLTVLALLEATGRVRLCTMVRLGLRRMPLSLLLLARERNRLCTLLRNRYLHMGRDFVPKSVNWALIVLDALPEHIWRLFMRMDRVTYAHLATLLEPLLRIPRRRTSRALSLDMVQKVGLYRLGHYGNFSSTYSGSRSSPFPASKACSRFLSFSCAPTSIPDFCICFWMFSLRVFSLGVI